MPYLTTRKNLKLQLSPGLVASYDIQPGNGVGLFWDTKHTHIFTYLLTFPGPTRGGLIQRKLTLTKFKPQSYSRYSTETYQHMYAILKMVQYLAHPIHNKSRQFFTPFFAGACLRVPIVGL